VGAGGGDRPTRRLARYAWPAAAALALLLSLGQAGRPQPGTDFHVFWEAGRDFADGSPLYQPAPGARWFKYPPFAAMLFQPLGWLSLDAAAVAFHALGLLLLAWAAVATWRIAEAWAPGRRRGAAPMVLAILAVLHVAQSDLLHLQTNLLVLALCLAGVLAAARGRAWPAAAWLTAATLLKLTPAVLLGWLTLRGGRRAPAAIALCLALGLAAPLAQRGLRQGVQDYGDYVRTFLAPTAGRVWTRPQNQALTAAVERAMVPEAVGPGVDYAWLPAGPRAARLVRFAATLLVAGGFVAGIVVLAWRRRPHSLFEVAAALTAANLLSGITWKAHLVGLLFVGYAFLSLPLEAWPASRRRALLGLSALIVASGLAGRSVTGAPLQEALFGYSAWTWLLLLLFAASLLLAFAPPARLGAPDGGPTGAGRS